MICEHCGRGFYEDWRKQKRGSPRYCSQSCSSSRQWTKEDREKKSFSARKSSKVLQANEQQRQKAGPKVRKICPICGVSFEVHPYQVSKIYCSRKCYDAPGAEKFRKVSPGGYREGSGRGITGYYKGIYCASTWELAYVVDLMDRGIPFSRNTKKYVYQKKNGTQSTYIPDFLVGDSIVEIKGPQDIHWKEKYAAFPYREKLIVISKKEISSIIERVKRIHKVQKLEELYTDNAGVAQLVRASV